MGVYKKLAKLERQGRVKFSPAVNLEHAMRSPKAMTARTHTTHLAPHAVQTLQQSLSHARIGTGAPPATPSEIWSGERKMFGGGGDQPRDELGRWTEA